MAVDKWEILRRQNEALVRVYKDAYMEIAEKLKRQVERGLSTHHAEALIRDIQEIVRQLDEYTYDWLVANAPLAYEVGSESAIQKLATYGMPNISASFGGVHQEAVRSIVIDTFQGVAGATKLMEQTLVRTLRDSSKGIFQRGLVTGETRKRLTKELMLDLAGKGFTMFEDEDGKYIKLKDYIDFIAEDSWVGFVDAAGRKWDLLNYTEMLTRTKTAEAVSRGTENRLIENGLDLVMITSHGAEDWCRFYEGKVFSISGTSKDYPPLSEAPNGGTPFHPRCRHRESPFVEKFEDEETIKRAKDLDKKYLGLNKDGYADQATLRKFEENFDLRGYKPKRLSLTDRDKLDIIGLPAPARNGLFHALDDALDHGLISGTECLLTRDAKTGKTLYNKVVGNTDSVIFPNELCDKLSAWGQGKAHLVHNHPSSSCFSPEDVSLFRYSSIHSLSVVGHDQTMYYIEKKNPGANIDRRKIFRDYQMAVDRYMDQFQPRVLNGEIGNDEAWKEHSHLAIRLLARINGLRYRRWVPNG